jgi:hypothetical protein
VCLIDNDTQSTTALLAAQFSGGCYIPTAATITEVDVLGGTGVIGSTSYVFTGTSSINLLRYTPSSGSTATILVNSGGGAAPLATASGKACALTTFSGTCANTLTSSSTIKIGTTALNAGDWIYAASATPDTVQTWYRIAIIYTY